VYDFRLLFFVKLISIHVCLYVLEYVMGLGPLVLGFREERVDRETAAAALQYPRRYSTAGTVHTLGLEGSG
jgi:hypothetical protein